AGVKVSDEDVIKAIGLHNRNRALLRELSGLRKQEPPLLSGAEMTQVVIAVLTLPVEESIRRR
ncbi:MAG: 2-hydroxyacyl-CoA dehydratase family protein, partial [Syntrophales bacterium LBB04]|nr:2-hydroxyacyl-CoA dehydratase family protein [Syntrophales bacterium LBB04]